MADWLDAWGPLAVLAVAVGVALTLGVRLAAVGLLVHGAVSVLVVQRPYGNAQEAQAPQPQPLRSRDVQERYVALATQDWHAEMQARQQALARHAAREIKEKSASSASRTMETRYSFFYNGRWWWKPGQSLCRPFAGPMPREAVFPPGPLPQPAAPVFDGLVDSPEHPNQPPADPTTEVPVCDFVVPVGKSMGTVKRVLAGNAQRL
jgi:hypothetical protein